MVQAARYRCALRGCPPEHFGVQIRLHQAGRDLHAQEGGDVEGAEQWCDEKIDYPAQCSSCAKRSVLATSRCVTLGHITDACAVARQRCIIIPASAIDRIWMCSCTTLLAMLPCPASLLLSSSNPLFLKNQAKHLQINCAVEAVTPVK